MDRDRPDVAKGIFVGLMVVFLFGMFVGLPLVVWFLLIAAFVGTFVATASRREHEQEEERKVPHQRRPWDKRS